MLTSLSIRLLCVLSSFSLRRDQRGQGTVEYVALILLVAAVFTAVVAAGHGKDFGLTAAITGKLKDAISSVKAK